MLLYLQCKVIFVWALQVKRSDGLFLIFFPQEKISDDKKTSLREKRATVTSSTTYTDIPVPTLFSSAMRLRLGRRRGFRRDDVSKVNREMSKHDIQGFQWIS